MNKKIKNILKFVVPIIIVYLIISSIYIFAHIGIGTAQSLECKEINRVTNVLRVFMGLPSTQSAYMGVGQTYLIQVAIKIVIAVVLLIFYPKVSEKNNRKWTIVAILVLIVTTLCIGVKVIKNNIQEIKIVTDKMMELDKETRLKVNSNDEVGELKQQINDLYSTLLRTIDNLEFKNKEILKLEKLKYDFFKGASHELKTPLASLKIILENMKYNIGKYKERDIYINECIDIVDSLTKNISQILSVHSIENLNNDEEYLKINDTLEDILKKYEILANQKKITVNNYILDENIYIGKTALKIILSNLISNAVKYTDVNGVINIGIVDDWLYIENSYGNNRISNMDEIFDVKFDLNKENSNGLGLYIVSNILNNYNIEYKALQDEEFFIFKIKIFS